MSSQNISPVVSIQKPKKTNVLTLLDKKRASIPITMLTAYDYPTARAVDQAGIDVILVGDSLGMVVLGYPNTLSVTMEDMLHHCKAVSRGAQRAMLIGDMPFMSYQSSTTEAIRNAGRFLQEANMDGIKLEGGRERLDTIRSIHAAGIPVMGHLGLTPQRINQLGGFRPQGKNALTAQRLLEDALKLEEAGCFSIVLELIPAKLATFISEQLEIITIGIGAGDGCNGQVLVIHDLLGIYDRFTPRFVKQYKHLYQEIIDAIGKYKTDVENHLFPTSEHSIEMPEEEWQAFIKNKVPSNKNE